MVDDIKSESAHHDRRIYAVIIGCLAALGIVMAIFYTTGLPSLKDSPTATVSGQSMAGKTGSD